MKPRVNLNLNSGVYQAMLGLETYIRKSSGLETSLLGVIARVTDFAG